VFGRSLRFLSTDLYPSADIEYLSLRETIARKVDKNSRRPRFNVLVGQTKFLNCLDPGEFTFARSTNGSRGFDAAANFEASIVEFYCREFNSARFDKEFISGFCDSSPSATAGYTMAGGVRVVVIHVLLTAFDGDGLLHIIGAASSAFRSGACLCTLEYVLVSDLVFVGGKAGGPGGSSTNSAGGLVPNFGSSSDGLPFRGRGIASSSFSPPAKERTRHLLCRSLNWSYMLIPITQSCVSSTASVFKLPSTGTTLKL